MMQITEKAALKIKEISDSEGIGHYTVRVKVIGGGCAGMVQDMFFDNIITDMDEVMEFIDYYGTIKIIVDPLSIQYLDESTIDYLESPIGGGFKFKNPNVKSQCGCGNSVSF